MKPVADWLPVAQVPPVANLLCPGMIEYEKNAGDDRMERLVVMARILDHNTFNEPHPGNRPQAARFFLLRDGCFYVLEIVFGVLEILIRRNPSLIAGLS